MDEIDNKKGLSEDQLDMVSGGGVAAAEAYLEQLMKEKGVPRHELYDHMTPEEYQHYVNLYNDTPETPVIKLPNFMPSIPDLLKPRKP